LKLFTMLCVVEGLMYVEAAATMLKLRQLIH